MLKWHIASFICKLYHLFLPNVEMEILHILLQKCLLQNELYEKAKNEILDEVISLSQVTPQHW